MKKMLLLLTFSILLQLNVHAMNLDSYINQTGNYASQIDGEFSDPSSFDQYIGGSGGQDLTANAFQFTISQPISISNLSLNVTVLGNPNGTSNATLPLTFQLYNGTTTGAEGIGVAPNLNSLFFSSNSTQFSSNGVNNNVYNGQSVSFNTSLQPGTYWFADEITPPTLGGATVDLQSVNFMGTVVTPEPSTWLLFTLVMLLVAFKGFYTKKDLL